MCVAEILHNVNVAWDLLVFAVVGVCAVVAGIEVSRWGRRK